jgi:pimeloyl-ACP methyl ester carboxylesterase
MFALMPYEYPALMFHNVEAGAALLTAGVALDDPEWLKGFLVTNARQLGMAGRILFPIPDRGLSSRLYRIRAKTILIWGDSDKLISPVYAEAFKKGIKGAELVAIPEAGHMVTIEKPEQVLAALGRLG